MKKFLFAFFALALGLTALNLGGPAGCGGTTLSSNADLSALGISEGSLSPSFDSGTLTYNASVAFLTRSLSVTPTAADAGASIQVNGATVLSGQDSEPLALNEGNNTVTVEVTAADGATTKTYSLTVTRNGLAEQAYLKATNAEMNDFFGFPVAISGNTLVVADAYDDSNATGVNGDETNNGAPDAGSVFVFVRDGSGNWTKQAYLKASNAEAGDRFGEAVAISGDTIVVGTINEASGATGVNGNEGDNSATRSGAAYVFVRDGSGNWTQQAYLKASNTGSFDFFGNVVAISGNTLVVGASNEDSDATVVNGDGGNDNAQDSGAAYVFVRDGSGNWSQQAYLKASNAETMDYFGGSVSVSGDTAVIGAVNEDGEANGVPGAGAAYVFARDGSGNWGEEAILRASDVAAGDELGYSVAISDDTVVAGAAERDGRTGAAYLFGRDLLGDWSELTSVTASNAEAGDDFGISVAISGDTVVVEADGEDGAANGISNSGAVYVFE